MKTSRKLSRRFKVGDWVSFDYGIRRITAQVVEDRGTLGVQGRRLYRVRPMPSREDLNDFELAEEELEPATEPEEMSAVRPTRKRHLSRGRSTWSTPGRATRGIGSRPRSQRRDIAPPKPGRCRLYDREVGGGIGRGAIRDRQRACGCWPGRGAKFVFNDIQRSADEIFKQKHPEAIIHHEDL